MNTNPSRISSAANRGESGRRSASSRLLKPAIVLVGLLFGLAHGLILSLPVLAVFGGALAWIRARTGSIYPGMILHSLFNLFALVAAVTLSK